MPLDANTQILAQVPLFSILPESELQALALSLSTRQFNPGEILFREGERGDRFYVVRKGEVEIVKAMGSPQENISAARGPGEFIGEMSLLNRDSLRTASVRALSQVVLWEMTRRDFDTLLNRYPQLAYEMVRVLSLRLTAAHNAEIKTLEEKNRQLSSAYEELKAAQAQIIEKERLERDLQVAHDIQMSILPARLPEIAGYDFGACLVPARSVGGDFYDLFGLPHARLGIMIGDVTDKGVPAAIFMAQAHAFLLAAAEADLPPAEVLLNVNRHLMAMDEAGLFVTVLYGVLDFQSGVFSYARAGHELPMLCQAGVAARLCPRNPGQPLGIFDAPLLDEQTLRLSPGESLLLYTDGVMDERDPQGERYGIARLVGALGAAAGKRAQATCDGLLGELQAHQSGAPQDDDITLVAIRRESMG
jgi:sigma-B regulation protein RsbU (phosphoserine phosphatase)